MSADEFDPAIERLFARTPALPDASLFTAQVEHRLQKGSRLRYMFLGVAGLVGGVVAAREMITVNFDLGAGSGALTTGAVGQGIESASFSAQSALQSGLDHLGMGGVDMGAFGGMQMFWVAAGALIAVAAAAMVRLSQEV
ncbi:MAG: hypothetical protein ACK4UQ_07530 [Brevundimonas sp.]|nr:MAG: hypothetical protein EON86_01355 [Brevundimonas sp.]